MKKSVLFLALSSCILGAHAQSEVSISGNVKLALTHGNDGTAPLFGQAINGTSMNDQSSTFWFKGKEDLGEGNYAGFTLGNLFNAKNGASVSSGKGNTLWFLESTVKVGGKWGEVYAGRSVTPLFMTAIQADPWFWDNSVAQLNWDFQQANYRSASFLRTDGTVGYKSPSINGWSAWFSYAPGEGAVTGDDIGASLSYSNGPIWASLATDQHKSASGSGLTDRNVTLAGAYNFGAVRPMMLYSTSKVEGVSYSGFTLGATIPVSSGSIKVGYGSLSDWNTATVVKESAKKLSLGYDHSLSKRTTLFANVATANADGATRTNAYEIGINHNF